ncbi:MAG: hypothetical protein V4472_13125 [Pseudomonadota bacterium]
MAELANATEHYGVAFGLRWRSAFPLPVFAPAAAGAFDVRVERGPWPVEPMPSDGRKVVIGQNRVRLLASADCIIDILAADRIAVSQAEAGPLCAQFFGGAAALLMALRGMAPLHASAVAIGGRAVLVCGAGGAGKSSFAATLIGQGGQLISDDLSVLTFDGDGRACVLPGRTTIRLFPELAWLLGNEPGPSEISEGGKLRFQPRHVGGIAPIPIGSLVHLDASDSAIPRALATNLLVQQVYRRPAMARLPGTEARFAMIDALATQVPLQRIVGLMERQVDAFVKRAKDLVGSLA